MAKLVLKYGEVAIEYEEPEQFLKEELPQIIKAVSDLGAVAPPPTAAQPKNATPLPNQSSDCISHDDRSEARME